MQNSFNVVVKHRVSACVLARLYFPADTVPEVLAGGR